MSTKPSDLSKFAAQGFNRVPLMREVLADLDTPVSTYLKLAEGRYSYLFESVHGGEKWGRYSIIGLPCASHLRVSGRHLELWSEDEMVERTVVENPLEEIRRYSQQYRVAPVDGMPRFTGGLVGYFGYETVRYIEKRLPETNKRDAIGAPDILLLVSEEVLVFDNLSGRLYVITHVDPSQPHAWQRGQDRLTELVADLRRRAARIRSDAEPKLVEESDFRSAFCQVDFEAAVQRSRSYIRDGDIMQVVLSQRMSTPFTAPPLNMYRALRTVNPSPYMYFLDLGDFQIVGSSPEILVRLEDDTVTLRPIAGTRRRGRDAQDDLRLEEELMADPKELAEHLMLVDLGRNDVGRVSRTGTVSLTERMAVERYSHVMHIVSNVEGRLSPGLDAIDVLNATFPAGTVSGAPKVRAMEIIDELEPDKRGIYSGAVGYLGWHGNMDTAIAIRTAVIKDRVLHIQAGAGIVADSIAEREWMETMNKGRVVFRAAAMASSGLAEC